MGINRPSSLPGTDVASLRINREKPRIGTITRMGRWCRKKVLQVLAATGLAIAAENCTFDTSGLAGAPDARNDARPLDDGSLLDASDSALPPDANLDAQPTDAEIPDAQTSDAQPNPDAQTTDAQPNPDASGDAQVLVEICGQPGDEDGNGLQGCAEATCIGQIGPEGVVCEENESTCNDGKDNDGDGLVDCADPDCVGEQGTGGICQATETTCDDDFANTGNGLPDCQNVPDCGTAVNCAAWNALCPTEGVGCDSGGGVACAPGTCRSNRCIPDNLNCY